jgi:hypothetical protein
MTVNAVPVPEGAAIAAHDAAVRQAFAQVQAAVAASADLKAVPSNLEPSLANAARKDERLTDDGCVRSFLEVAQPECAMGDTSSPTSIALVGDSNAAMWNPAFRQAAEDHHWRLEALSKAGCPMLDLPMLNPILGREYSECEEWRTGIVIRLQAEHPKLVVLSMLRRYGPKYGWAVGFTSYEQAWLDSLTRVVKQMRSTGAQVLVLGPIPDPLAPIPDCLSVHLDDATACEPARAKAVNVEGIAAESAATKAGGGQYIDISDLFCTAERCPVIVGKTLVYLDQNHVTNQYSKALAPVMGALAARALAQR